MEEQKNGSYVENLEQFYAELKKFIELKFEYYQISLVEKLTRIISALLILFTVMVLSLVILFYLLFALAYALEPAIGYIASFSCVAGLFLILLLIFFIFRKKLVVNPILRFMVKIFYDETKERKDINDNKE